MLTGPSRLLTVLCVVSFLIGFFDGGHADTKYQLYEGFVEGAFFALFAFIGGRALWWVYKGFRP
jgi:hypothetical protein